MVISLGDFFIFFPKKIYNFYFLSSLYLERNYDKSYILDKC